MRSEILLAVRFSWRGVRECLVSASPQVVNSEASSEPAFALHWSRCSRFFQDMSCKN